LNQLRKVCYLFPVAAFVFAINVSISQAQDRPRVISSISSRPTNQPVAPTQRQVTSSVESRPTNVRPPLVQDIQIQKSIDQKELVKKTVSSTAAFSSIIASRSIFASSVTSTMQRAIFSRLGIPYLYGSSGPNRYDCSGFVWAVFRDAGIDFERQSARTLWAGSTPVEGDERFRFGTLVFFNGLGHMGIVADENGFYHASSSKGITYSTFKGYWQNRIVGFRRLGASPSTAISEK
jgi:cell wall-associated NlpC family hydrolase